MARQIFYVRRRQHRVVPAAHSDLAPLAAGEFPPPIGLNELRREKFMRTKECYLARIRLRTVLLARANLRHGRRVDAPTFQPRRQDISPREMRRRARNVS